MESTQIDQALRRAAETKEIPGVVAIAATGKELMYVGAFGKRDLSKQDPMTTDSVFWIASMSKAITSAAAMQLVEQGKLSLDHPIGKVLPDLASPQVLEGFDASGRPFLGKARSAAWVFILPVFYFLAIFVTFQLSWFGLFAK